ncbi:ABC-three component system protein [Mesorhizobium sp. BAC0120]|uniref:ABC-three component system protein n=1 Tax=Mesorhizobium sp. BAC0120 TaxID=3090670 RepID=UPI00298C2804|nr:ABC-three component system protein [Mesorhizobium sp. BAC0120]MDW6021865.1 ABC-three component system protein [Mesorhizobium sp. BAC0120]
MNAHSADASALGFLYQAQYALLRLWNETSLDAVIYLETLDDVVLEANGQTILEQLKHSLSTKPDAITVASVNLWKTLRAWIDVLPDLDLSKTSLHLVTVADISPTSPLKVLLDETEDRGKLLIALQEEAQRVVQERADAEANGIKPLPHAKRAPGCEAFLNLSSDQQAEILSRVRLMPGQQSIRHIEDELAKSLTSVLAKDQPHVAALMVEWWNRQIIHAHCGKRDKAIHRFELVKRHMEIVADIEHDNLVDYFAAELPPETYRSHPMVENQIGLVEGTKTWLQRAVTNEWRARESRSRWSTENPTWRERISKYDDRLAEEWSYRHSDMCEECDGQSDEVKKTKGRELLKWSFYEAPDTIESLTSSVTAPSYVRGTYHVLSIDGRVGWHPDYFALLGFKK